MLPDISDFNFGQSKSFELTLEEPPARPAVVYTAWHVWRVLQHHKRDIQAGKKNYTVTPILKAFQDLDAVRLIQPYRRFQKGKVDLVTIRPPLKPREQAAILLYVLSPAEEGEKCSCCKAHGGSGPFRRCIATQDEWTGGACLNCYFTGTSSKCDWQKAHEAATRRALEDKGAIPRRLTKDDVEAAESDEIETWLAQIEEEERRRFGKKSQVMGRV